MSRIINPAIIFCLVAPLLGGCRRDSDQWKAVHEELEKINARLDRLESGRGFGPSTTDFKRSGPDLSALDKIRFPEDPTREALKKYIQEILDASEGQNVFSPDDPQVAMLCQVGEENIDLLIDASMRGPWTRHHLTHAVIRLASESSKDVVISGLAANHELIEAIVRNGWENDVKDILVDELRRKGPFPGDKYLPRQWVRAVAGFKDPDTYDALIDHFVNGSGRYSTYEAIRGLPGIELGEHVPEAWENAKRAGDWERVEMAIVAVEYGQIDALATLVDNLGSERFDYYGGRMRLAITRHTEADGSNDEIIEWFKANKDNLRFDEASREFKAKP